MIARFVALVALRVAVASDTSTTIAAAKRSTVSINTGADFPDLLAEPKLVLLISYVSIWNWNSSLLLQELRSRFFVSAIDSICTPRERMLGTNSNSSCT